MRKIGNNTFERLENINDKSARVISLHNTDIIKFFSNYTVLNSGGWRTKTTKDRINTFVPWIKVFQKKNNWYVKTETETLEFEDNMIINDK
jgi:hypothetical protein